MILFCFLSFVFLSLCQQTSLILGMWVGLGAGAGCLVVLLRNENIIWKEKIMTNQFRVLWRNLHFGAAAAWGWRCFLSPASFLTTQSHPSPSTMKTRSYKQLAFHQLLISSIYKWVHTISVLTKFWPKNSHILEHHNFYIKKCRQSQKVWNFQKYEPI